MNRVTEHPILDVEAGREISFFYNGEKMTAREGDTIASALTDNGVRVYRTTVKRGEPRGMYCGIGQCTDCVMIVDGVPNVRTCVTFVKENMRVETQHGLGGTA